MGLTQLTPALKRMNAVYHGQKYGRTCYSIHDDVAVVVAGRNGYTITSGGPYPDVEYHVELDAEDFRLWYDRFQETFLVSIAEMNYRRRICA